MATTYHVSVTAQAQEQMQEIVRYIAQELKAPDAALHLLDTLEKAISALSHMPNSIALTDEEPWHGLGIHRMPVKNFLVYFLVDEDMKRVQITAVIYSRRDQARQLSQMSMD